MAKHDCNKEKEIIEIGTDIKYIRLAVDEIKTDVKKNTAFREKVADVVVEIRQNSEFRNKATGILGLMGAIAGVVGGAIVWIFSKIWGDK